MTPRRVTVAERRHRLGRRHHLAAPQRAADAVTVAGELGGLHATDPATVFLSARARVAGFEAADLEAALYDERRAVRMLGMRRTLWVVPVAMAPVVHQACGRKVAAANRARLVRLLEGSGTATDGGRWLADVEAGVLGVLAARGDALADELAEAVPALRAKVALSPGKPYGATVALTNQVLTHLAAEGHIVRGRPKHGWTTNQYRWAPLGQWVPGGLDTVGPEEAEETLAATWLGAFGPAPAADLQWWAGWTARQTRRALGAIGAVEVALDEGAGWVRADDADPVEDHQEWAALLPALDPTAMGWAGRDWYLGGHRAELFDRSGNIGPTVWSDGRIVGGWAQRGSDIAYRLLEPLGRDAATRVETEAGRLAEWLGATRITPRFPTPLDARLRAERVSPA